MNSEIVKPGYFGKPVVVRNAVAGLGAILFAAATVSAADNEPSDAGFSWRQDANHVALVDRDGGTVWQFNHAPDEGLPYFHPVALPGGTSLTWHAPPDHPWHYGLWFSWKFINGVNYWEFDRTTRRHEGLTTWKNVRQTTRADSSARIELDLNYRPLDMVSAVLTEQRVIEVSAPAEDGSFWMDWVMTFRAGDQPVLLERTPITGQADGKSWGGYAGLIWRFAEAFRDWTVINSDGGRGEACHGQRSRAIDYSGIVDDRAQGVAILDHPTNFRAPTPWYVTTDSKTPFACVMPAPLFDKGHQLGAGEQLTLRYRIIVHPGRWEDARLGQEVDSPWSQ